MTTTTHARAAVALALAGCGSVTTDTKVNEPTITMVVPDHGSVIGGTSVTLTGTHFAAGTTNVVVGGHLATNATVTSPTSITFVAPAGDQEGAAVDIEVSTHNGLASLPRAFTYNFRPIAVSVSPAGGKIGGGTTITITGRGFAASDGGTPTIQIAGGKAINVQVVNDTTVMATTAAAMPGTRAFVPADVSVTNANGSTTLARAYLFTKQGLLAAANQQRGCNGLGAVAFVDTVDGSSTVISTSGVHLHGCALAPTGTMFVVGSTCGSPHSLYTLDPLTGTAALVGPLQTAANVQKNISSLTFNGAALFGIDASFDASFGASSPSNQLASINPTNGQVTLLGASAMAVSRNNAIAPKDAGALFVADTFPGSFDTIVQTGSTRTVGPGLAGGTSGQSFHGMASTGTGVFIATTDNIIYQVTVGSSNATLALVANLGGGGIAQIGGLCPTPASF